MEGNSMARSNKWWEEHESVPVGQLSEEFVGNIIAFDHADAKNPLSKRKPKESKSLLPIVFTAKHAAVFHHLAVLFAYTGIHTC